LFLRHRREFVQAIPGNEDGENIYDCRIVNRPTGEPELFEFFLYSFDDFHINIFGGEVIRSLAAAVGCELFCGH
jgi:hypothetical protein